MLKKLLFFLLLTINCFAFGELSLKIKKTTNGGYVLSIPHFEKTRTEGLLLQKQEFALLFTSPRGSLTSANHYGIFSSTAFGFETGNLFTTFSLDLEYLFEGNSDLRKEGFYFYNTLNFGIKF